MRDDVAHALKRAPRFGVWGRLPTWGRLSIGLFALWNLAAQEKTPDLRGIWQAQNNANVNLETAKVIVDPPGGKIPYQPAALSKRQENFKMRATADPETKCFQPGVPRAAYLPYPFQIFQNAQGVYIVYQRTHAYRVIPLDGGPHNEGLDFFMGDSRGRWEGDTLVVDVTSMNERAWLDMAGNFHSAGLHVEERYTRRDRVTLRYEATLQDPRVYTRPWKMRMLLRLQAGAQLIEDECVEDARGVRHHVSGFK